MKKYWLLILALILGTVLRLYQLGSLPNALTWDEAALGYNAYSIIKTGRDEFGKFLPIIFKSFGDFKPGLYVYLAIPPIAVLGLTEFAVRLPSALAGILAIYGIFLLTNELFSKKSKPKNQELTTENCELGSYAALSLAIMPWHIHFSRGAWETNVFVTLLLFALYFLLVFIRSGKFLTFSLILALLTFLTYQAAKLFTPLVLVLPVLLYWSEFRDQFKLYFSVKKNKAVVAFVLAFFLSLTLSTMSGESANRLKRLSIFGYHPGISEQLRATDSNNSLSLSLFHNQPQLPFDFIWFVLGVIFLVRSPNLKNSLLIAGLLLLAPLPGSLTLSEYSTVRALFLTIPLAVICGLGAYYALTKIKPLFFFVALLSIVFFVYFLDLLFVHSNFIYAKEFQYGYKEAMQFINQYPQDKVVMTDVLGQPYIFYLFYSRFDPATYQKINEFQSGGYDVGNVAKVGLAEFHQSGLSEVSNQFGTIFVGTIGNFPENFDFSLPTIEKHVDVLFPNGDISLRIIKTKDK
ncbi:MAG: Glycosyl transferase family 39 [Microgenomates group bacterium GW2011_GWC1_44_23]|nr:MAG: Glycosyl transferase family 39 [Microgenomates group bacterium GW2011_GWC1_44_23]